MLGYHMATILNYVVSVIHGPLLCPFQFIVMLQYEEVFHIICVDALDQLNQLHDIVALDNILDIDTFCNVIFIAYFM